MSWQPITVASSRSVLKVSHRIKLIINTNTKTERKEQYNTQSIR